jgi:hypothetical protein
MLDHAIRIDDDAHGVSIVETNNGRKLNAPRWPQDCEFQLVCFNESKESCDIIRPEDLAKNIKIALDMIAQSGVLNGEKPNWYLTLVQCAQGA